MNGPHVRSGLAGATRAAGRVFCLLALLVPAAGFAAENSDAPRPRKKVQEVDLHRLEIQGRLDNPASVFLLEKGATPLSNLWTLDGLLPAHWLTHVDKETLDRRASAAPPAESGTPAAAAEEIAGE